MLGISLYPEKASFEEMKDYMLLSKKYGFNQLFLSLLQIDKDNVTASYEKYKRIIAEAKNKDFEVIIDFVPQLFELFGESYKDLKFLSDLGVNSIRLDAGMTGKEEAEMSRNPYDIKIQLNMSNYSHYLDQILDYGPNRRCLTGCHNFFPQNYTGLSRKQFEKYTLKFRKNNLNTAAFITSQTGKYGPWVLQEGLCTLEEHRNLPVSVQALDLIQSGLIDDVIVGTMFASEEELKAISIVSKQTVKNIEIVLSDDITEFEKQILLDYIHNYRGDSSEYMIRSTRIRAKITEEPLPVKIMKKSRITKGDILILNESYGQYKGEVQIALKDRPMNEKINVVGKISEQKMILVDSIQRHEDFRFVLEEN